MMKKALIYLIAITMLSFLVHAGSKPSKNESMLDDNFLFDQTLEYYYFLKYAVENNANEYLKHLTMLSPSCTKTIRKTLVAFDRATMIKALKQSSARAGTITIIDASVNIQIQAEKSLSFMGFQYKLKNGVCHTILVTLSFDKNAKIIHVDHSGSDQKLF